MRELVRMGGALTKRPLLAGNRIEPLVGSNEAYPAMLAAIESAQQVDRPVYLHLQQRRNRAEVCRCAGGRRARGVEVRVLIDSIGLRYTWPTILAPLKKAGVTVARFLPALVPIWFPYSNLRNHRKILVVDGRIGFHRRHEYPPIDRGQRHEARRRFRICTSTHGPGRAASATGFRRRLGVHRARVVGRRPLVSDARTAGADHGPRHQRRAGRRSRQVAAHAAGSDCLRQSSVQIVTPYFLPDSALITSLNVASMRGVQVDILLPEVNNLTAVQWASTAMWWQLLVYDCRIWLTPPPFEHTKLMLVDRHWSLVGSGNWDPRSLRLNFEFNVESYDRQLATRLGKLIEDKLARSRRVTLAEVDGRPLPIKLRDGVARLFSPYL